MSSAEANERLKEIIRRIRVEHLLASVHDLRLFFCYDIGRKRLSYVIRAADGSRDGTYDTLDEAIAELNKEPS